MPSLTIIIRTLGRESLLQMLESIDRQPLTEGDEVLIFGETEEGRGKEIVSAFPGQFRYICYPTPAGTWGQPAINYGISIARGDWINVQDDDDKMADGFMEKFRGLAGVNPGKLFMFDMIWPNRYVTPGSSRDPGSTGGCSIVFPNIKEKIGHWPNHIAADFDFMKDTIALHGGVDSVIWSSELITLYAGKHISAGKG